MPWKESDCVTERLRFVAEYLEADASFSELCRAFAISRKTGYKWVKRYQTGGPAALEECSRAPKRHPQAVAAEVVKRIIGTRCQHPRWGPRKLRIIIQKRSPWMKLPALSTIGEILKRNGLVNKRRRRRRSVPYAAGLREYAAPNTVWCADFKGHFLVGGARCHPLTISDGFSRFLLCCRALRRPLSDPTRKVFEACFREYGLPDAMRTDNGPPFSSLAPAGLSRLAVWWIRLGIRPERILPGRPDQNGRHERMHRTLKAEAAKPPCSSFRAQQKAFDSFRREYNFERPHEALGLQVPASMYRSSLRAFPNKLPEPEYPAGFETRLASTVGDHERT